MTSAKIYYYISHVETYATHRHVHFQKPEHLWKVRNAILLGNFVISNIINAVAIGLARPYYLGLGFLFNGCELLVLSPLMLIISVRLAREVEPGIEKYVHRARRCLSFHALAVAIYGCAVIVSVACLGLNA